MNPAEESVYAGLLVDDVGQWAFGTGPVADDDPLAGVDTTVPDGADPAALAVYALMLGDDALLLAHRLSQWCSRAPDLEEDVALANIALDLLGQARLFLARAAAADPSVVPVLPDDSPVPPEDALAFFRDEPAFRNVRLVEQENGDFAETVARLLVFSSYRLGLLVALAATRDPVLAAVAARGVKEVTYHRDWSARWFVVLAQGTAESRRRLLAGLATVWPLRAELFEAHPVERLVADQGVGVDPALLVSEVDAVLGEVFAAAGVETPALPAAGAVCGSTGRDGRHSEVLGRLLAEMQSVARAHPRGRW